MKKHTALLLSGALTLAIGAAVIVGNGWVASQVMAFGISEETPAKITGTSYEAQQAAANNDTLPEYDWEANPDEYPIIGKRGVITLLKSAGNGNVVTLGYTVVDGNVGKATVIYPSGEVELLEGEAAATAVEGFGGLELKEFLTYTEGEPGENDIVEADAIAIGINAVTDKYALKREILDKFNITAVFYTVYEDIDGAVWCVSLNPVNRDEYWDIGGNYTAILNAETGDALQVFSAVDGGKG